MDTEKKTKSRFHEVAVAILDRFTLMDDDFFSETLDGKIDAIQFILDTVLGRNDLKVIETKTQREYKSATKRSIKLDIWAKDVHGRVVDIEIQRADKGIGAKRARIHSSIIDRELLEKGQKFEEVAETFVIFITANDKYNAGCPLYHVDRRIQELDYREFADEAHIIYVNGAFQDTSHPVGRLMHDFWCSNADDMINDVLAKEVRYMKESEGGRASMCEMMEKMLKKINEAGKAEGRAEGRAEGKAEGITEGKQIQLYELVRKKIIPSSIAAAEAYQTEAEFKAGMDAYYAKYASA